MSIVQSQPRNAAANRIQEPDRAVHDWYRFVLSFPPHLVRDYLHKFGVTPGQQVLDPFCGTGTTLVECKKHGVESIGIEALPMPHFAASTKLHWDINSEDFLQDSEHVARTAVATLARAGIPDAPVDFDEISASLRELPPEAQRILLKNSISPLPLHKALTLRDAINTHGNRRYRSHQLLALARSAVSSSSNLHFGPEVGVRSPKADAPVVEPWMDVIRRMANDLRALTATRSVTSAVMLGDARNVARAIQSQTVDAIICSPPYPNEKDYTRTTRLESVLLGFVENRAQLRALKKSGMIRSNTRGVYTTDDDDKWISDFTEIQQLSQAIEDRRMQLGKTSGFERLYARVTRLYFGGMARHLASLRHVLKPGAKLAYVVGDQASYLRVMIRTGAILASIADRLGYTVESIDLFRTRFATATQSDLREEVVVLTWPGNFTGTLAPDDV